MKAAKNIAIQAGKNIALRAAANNKTSFWGLNQSTSFQKSTLAAGNNIDITAIGGNVTIAGADVTAANGSKGSE